MTGIRGRVDFKAAKFTIDRLPDDLAAATSGALDDLGRQLIKRIRATAPRAERRPPGETRQRYSESWAVDKKTPRTISLRTSQGFLYRILEFTGAKPGPRVPRRAQALRWYSRNGKPVFASRVWFPGFQPLPHVRPAMRVVMSAAPDIVFARFGAVNRLFRPSSKIARTRAKRKLSASRTVRRKTGRRRLSRRAVVRNSSATT